MENVSFTIFDNVAIDDIVTFHLVNENGIVRIMAKKHDGTSVEFHNDLFADDFKAEIGRRLIYMAKQLDKSFLNGKYLCQCVIKSGDGVKMVYQIQDHKVTSPINREVTVCVTSCTLIKSEVEAIMAFNKIWQCGSNYLNQILENLTIEIMAK